MKFHWPFPHFYRQLVLRGVCLLSVYFDRKEVVVSKGVVRFSHACSREILHECRGHAEEFTAIKSTMILKGEMLPAAHLKSKMTKQGAVSRFWSVRAWPAAAPPRKLLSAYATCRPRAACTERHSYAIEVWKD